MAAATLNRATARPAQQTSTLGRSSTQTAPIARPLTPAARTELARAKEASYELAILKAKSPPCGSGEVYDGTFSGTLVPGWGIAAATFRDAGITVIDETADFSRLS